jgi:Ca2+-transporting ATPase
VSNNSALTLNKTINLKTHALKRAQVFKELQSTKIGLDKEEIEKRIAYFGKNKLKEKKSFSVFALLLSQFTDILIIILFIAAVFSFFIGETIDAMAIFAIVLMNGFLGFFQEYKAEKSIEALKKMETFQTRVIRNGKEETVDAEDVVPGDILLLAEGDRIPADARILEVRSFEVDESMLTGESSPVSKVTEVLKEKTAVADQRNMVFSGTNVTKGKAKAIAVLTGMNTQVGKIAKDIQEAPHTLTPLQKALEKLGWILGLISILIAVPGLIIGVMTGRDVVEMMMMSVSLAVSAIPEGLPIVVTIALALGIKKMVKVNVLVRKLSTAESLGSTDVICSDKTGTITHNQMTAVDLIIPEAGFYNISGSGYHLDGEIKINKNKSRKFGLTTKHNGSELESVATNFVLCSDAVLNFGDPTERALIVMAHKLSLNEDKIRSATERIDEIPFDSSNKFMAVLLKNKVGYKALIKGAPEVIIAKSKLSKAEKEKLEKINDHLTKKGLRVLALAEKQLRSKQRWEKTDSYKFCALVGMYDPPREEVAESIRVCKKAGIRVMMITGDHKQTAQAIADQIGLNAEGALSGSELDELTDKEFIDVVKKVNVFARVAPEHKVKILKVLQAMGHQVAMTGDGVNDAAAIKRADVGIAVGSGTDLTKETSDMILLDDDFSTIAKAIREGRRIFFNIKKFIRFLISANFDEIARIFTSIIFGLPLSLLPIHILWLNLATDSLPALALTTDVADKDIMERKPYHPKKEILRGVISFSILAASIGYLVIFGLFLYCLFVCNLSLTHAQTLSFTTTVLFELFLVFAVRSERSVLDSGFCSNKLLCFSVLIAFLAQLFVIYNPIAQLVFKTVPLDWRDWILVLSASSSGLVIIEVLKLIKARSTILARFIPVG